MATAQQVIKTTEELIDGLARVAGCDRAEATIKYFAENPGAYALYDRAHKEKAKQSTASRTVEPAPTRRAFVEEDELNTEIDRAMRVYGLDKSAATVRVCHERPDLYLAYDRALKYPSRRHAEPTTEMNPGERPAAKPTKPTDSGMTDMMRLAQLVASGEMAMAKLLAAEILKGVR